MHKLLAIVFSLLVIPLVSRAFPPKIKLENVINRYWVMQSFSGGYDYITGDKETAKQFSGFIFRKDGTFEEFQRPGCAQNPPARKGTWQFSNDTMKVKATDNRNLDIVIVSADGTQLTIK